MMLSTIVSVVLDISGAPQSYQHWTYMPARVLRPIPFIAHYRYVRKIFSG